MRILAKLLLALTLLVPSLGVAQNSFYTDRAVGVSQFNGFSGLVPIGYGQVRVCTSADIATTTTPCPHVAAIFDLNGNPLSVVGGNFGQVTTDVVGRFNLQAAPGSYWIQVAASSSNTPQLAYAVTIGFASLSGVNLSGIANLSSKVIDNVRYADLFVSVPAAIQDACNGSAQGKVILGLGNVTGISSSIVIPSQCTIEGYGKNRSSLQASASLNAPVILLSGVSNVVLKGFTVDGNRAANANTFFCTSITGSTNVTLDDVLDTNCLTTGLAIISGNTNINVQNSEFSNSGLPLPSPNGSGIGVDPKTTTGNNHIHFRNVQVHDNNIGLFVGNSTSAASDDISIEDSSFYGNADDAISINTYQPNGIVSGLRIVGVHVTCNGWPANGVGFPSSCSPGFLQTGAITSTSGAGIDLIGPSGLLQNATVTGSTADNNLYDGISNDGGIRCTVSTVGTAVTASGACFDTKWKASQPVQIVATTFLIASVADTTHLTLATSAGTLNSVAFVGPSRGNNVFVGNTSFNNGNTIVGVGTGFFNFFADGNSWIGNTARNNNQEGMGIIGSSFVSVTGGRSEANGRNGTINTAGYQIGGSLNTQLIGASADDLAASPTQIRGVNIDANSTNTLVVSTSLYGSTSPVTNSGVNSQINLGSATRKDIRVSSCTTAASVGAVCNTTITWPGGGFSNNNYTVTCSFEDTANQARLAYYQNKTATSLIAVIESLGAAASGVIHCSGEQASATGNF